MALPISPSGTVNLGAAALRMLAGLAESLASALPGLALRGAAGAAGAIGGILLPGNIGQGNQVVDVEVKQFVDISKDQRFEVRQGEVYGRLLEHDPVSQRWEVVREHVRGVQTPQGFAVMNDEELARFLAPTTTPAAPQPPGLLPLPVWADRPEVLPPYRADGPVAPQVSTTPAQPVQD